jgi:hypothetical protein
MMAAMSMVSSLHRFSRDCSSLLAFRFTPRMAREHSCTNSRAAVPDALAAAMMSGLVFAAGLDRCARRLHCGHCKDSRHAELMCRYAECPHLRLEAPGLTQEFNIACVHEGAQTTLHHVASDAYVFTNVSYT